MLEENTDITVVSQKGQVVIPQAIRKKLGLKPKTKLVIYGYQDAVIMKKLEVPDVKAELEETYRHVQEKIALHGELTEADITEAVAAVRKKKHARETAK